MKRYFLITLFMSSPRSAWTIMSMTMEHEGFPSSAQIAEEAARRGHGDWTLVPMNIYEFSNEADYKAYCA